MHIYCNSLSQHYITHSIDHSSVTSNWYCVFETQTKRLILQTINLLTKKLQSKLEEMKQKKNYTTLQSK